MNTYHVKTLFCAFCMLLSINAAHANLLTDSDGYMVSMTTSGDDTNLFGPPPFDRFNPLDGFGNTIPTVPVPDGTQMAVSFFDTYIELRQFATSTFDPSVVDWLMLFSDIEADTPILSVSINDLTNTFAHPLMVTSTGSSIGISFDGGSSDSLSIGGPGWFARIDIEFEDTVSVPAPSIALMMSLCLFFICFKRKPK